MAAARAARALLTARAVAAGHGVRSTEPRVLQDGVNVVVHLAPARVVARVATLTPLLRTGPLRSFAREVAVAGALAAAGAPVVPPSDLLPPGPHRYAGLELSFRQHVEVLPAAPSPVEAAGALVELHRHLSALPVDGAPLDTPLDDLARFLGLGRAWGASQEELDRVRDRLDGEVVPLHGDAHPGNLLATPDGWRWTDLEDTCAGPRAWKRTPLPPTARKLAAGPCRGAAAARPTPSSRRGWSCAGCTPPPGRCSLRPAAGQRLAAALGTGWTSGSVGSR